MQLTADMEQLIASKVRTGRFHSAVEVVREALRQMDRNDQDRAVQLSALRRRMDRALEETTRDSGQDGERFLRTLLDGLDAAETERKAG